MALTLEQKAQLIAMTRRPARWRPMLVAKDGRVVRDVDVYVSPLDRNARNRTATGFRDCGSVIQVRRED
jgi:hypothetical protein